MARGASAPASPDPGGRAGHRRHQLPSSEALVENLHRQDLTALEEAAASSS